MRRLIVSALFGALAVSPAAAEVTAASSHGFAVHGEATVTAEPADVWIDLTDPAGWWSADHSWSGDAANLSLYPVIGGCFCEELPESGGTAEHARVIHVAPYRLLRLSGALGPLQGEGLAGTLTITLEPAGSGTKIGWDYVVGGFARADLASMAPRVDAVLAEQLGRLADRLGRQP